MAHPSRARRRLLGVKRLFASTSLLVTACTVPDFVFAPPSGNGGVDAVGGSDRAEAGEGGTGAVGVSGGEPGVGGNAGGSAACTEDCAGAPAEAGSGGEPPIRVDEIPGLLAKYAFDEPRTVFADDSGNARSARVGAFDWVTGKHGNAIDLDGAFGYVTLPSSGVTSGLGNFTVTVWAKPRSLAGPARLFDIGTGQTAFMTMTVMTAATGNPRFFMKTAGNASLYVDSSIALKLDVWQLVSVTQSGNTVTLYVDGVVAATSNAMTYRASSFDANQSYLGRSQFMDPLFDGALDEFRLYSRALSAAEIASVVAGNEVTSGIRLSYDFDEAEGEVVPEANGAKEARAQSGIVAVPGVVDGAIELDGAAGYAELPAGLLDGVGDFTIACFVRQKQIRSAARIFDFGTDSGNYIALMASASSQKLRFGARFEGGVEQVLDSVELPVDAWQHVAVTRAGTVVRVFVGGEETASRVVADLPSPLVATSNWLGRSHRGDALLNAALDDFRVYDRALGPREIAALAGQ